MKKKNHLICVTVVSHAGCITEVGTGAGASLPPLGWYLGQQPPSHPRMFYNSPII